MKYSKRDDELIALFIRGNQKAWEEFYKSYILHSEKLAKIGLTTHPNAGITYMEFNCIALENIYKALDKYVPGSMSFYTYWKTIVLLDYSNLAIERMNAKEVTTLQDTIPNSEREETLEATLGEDDSNIFSNIAKKEMMNYLSTKLELLNEKEKQIYIMSIMEVSPSEIMEKLNLTKRQYYLAKNSIKEILDIEIFKNYFK